LIKLLGLIKHAGDPGGQLRDSGIRDVGSEARKEAFFSVEFGGSKLLGFAGAAGTLVLYYWLPLLFSLP
jgi:hypothetical protein